MYLVVWFSMLFELFGLMFEDPVIWFLFIRFSRFGLQTQLDAFGLVKSIFLTDLIEFVPGLLRAHPL